MEAGAPALPAPPYGPPPPPPPPQHHASEPQGLQEETACLATIVQCLTLSLASLRGDPHSSDDQQLSLPDTREFLHLIVNLLESSPDAARLHALALDDEHTPVHILLSLATADSAGMIPSYTNRETFNDAGYTSIRTQSIQAVTKIVMLCAGAAAADTLVQPLYHLLTSTGAVDILLRLLANVNEVENVRTASAECLYVFIREVAPARDAVVKLHVIPFFFNLLWSERSKIVRCYLCAMIKTVGEEFSENLLDAGAVARAVTLLQTEASKHVAIMLLDILTLIVSGYPKFYIDRLHGDTATLRGLSQLCEAVLLKNTEGDVVQAVTRLMEAVFTVEGPDREHTEFCSTVLTTSCWKALVPIPPADQPWDAALTNAAVLKITSLRHLVQACTTAALVDALNAAFAGHFPAMSFLLNAPLDDGHPLPLKQEGALVVAMWLAKSAGARSFMRSTLDPYATWAAALKDKLHELLMGVDAALFEALFLVDAHMSYLNNPSEPHIDYSDMASIYNAVTDMFQAQEQHAANGTAAASPAPATALHDTSRLHTFETTDSRVRIKAGQRKQRLTLAILNYVVEITFGKDGGQAQQRSQRRQGLGQSMNASGVAPISPGAAAAAAAAVPATAAAARPDASGADGQRLPSSSTARDLIHRMQAMMGNNTGGGGHGGGAGAPASPPPGTYSAYRSMHLPPAVTSPGTRPKGEPVHPPPPPHHDTSDSLPRHGTDAQHSSGAATLPVDGRCGGGGGEVPYEPHPDARAWRGRGQGYDNAGAAAALPRRTPGDPAAAPVSPFAHQQPAPPVDPLEFPAYSSTGTRASSTSTGGGVWGGREACAGGIPPPPGPSWKVLPRSPPQQQQRPAGPPETPPHAHGGAPPRHPPAGALDSPPEPLYKVAQRRIEELQRKQQRQQQRLAATEEDAARGATGGFDGAATMPHPIPAQSATVREPSAMSVADAYGDLMGDDPSGRLRHAAMGYAAVDPRDRSMCLDDLGTSGDAGVLPAAGSVPRAVPYNSVATGRGGAPAPSGLPPGFPVRAVEGDAWRPPAGGGDGWYEGPYMQASPPPPPPGVDDGAGAFGLPGLPPPPPGHPLHNRPAWPPWPPPAAGAGDGGGGSVYVPPTPPAYLRGPQMHAPSAAGPPRGSGPGTPRGVPAARKKVAKAGTQRRWR